MRERRGRLRYMGGGEFQIGLQALAAACKGYRLRILRPPKAMSTQEEGKQGRPQADGKRRSRADRRQMARKPPRVVPARPHEQACTATAKT